MKRMAAFLLALALSGIPILANGLENDETLLGQREQAIRDSEEARQVLYKIDEGLTVTEGQALLMRSSETYTNAQNQEMIAQSTALSETEKQTALADIQVRTDQEILDGLIDDIVVIAEARALGIEATESDAATYLDENERMVRDALKSEDLEEREDSQKALDRVDDYIKGTGLSKAEYRRQVQVPGAQKLLTIGKMKERLMEQKGLKREQLDEPWAEYVKSLREKYPSVE